MAIIGRIREKTGLLVFAIALAIICFLLMDTGSGGGGTPNSIGEVNGINLDGREYSRRVEQTLNNFQQSGQPIDEAARINAKNSAYNSYVKDVLAKEEYEKLGITMSDAEMDELIYGANPHPSVKNEPTFQDENGQFSADKVREYLDGLRASGDEGRARSWNNFKNFLRRDGMRKKYSSLISQAMYVPAFLAESKNAESNGTAAIEYVKVPYTQVNDNDISFTDNDLRAYLNENKGQFEQDESRAVDYIVYDIDASDIDIATTKNSIDELINDFKSTSSEDIGSFLSLNSETKFNNFFYTREQLATNSKVDEIFAAAEGTVLPTYLENNTYKAIKVVSKQMQGDTLEQVKFAELSRAIIPSSETTGEIFRRASEFAGRNNSESKFRAAAEQMNLSVQSSGDFSATTASIGTIGASESLINWAFTNEVGEVSEVIEMDGKYVVAILTAKKEAGMPSVDDVRDELESAVKNQKKAEKIISQISGSDLEAIASQFNTTTGNADGLKYNFISTGDLGKEPKVIAAAFALKQGEVSKPFAGDQGVFVIKTTSLDVNEIADMTTFKNTERTKQKTAVDFYAQEALFQNAKIDDARMRNIALAAQQQQ